MVRNTCPHEAVYFTEVQVNVDVATLVERSTEIAGQQGFFMS